MVSPEIISGREDQESSEPKIEVIEAISRNVQVVEIAGQRKYQVLWKTGVPGIEGGQVKKGKEVVCYFDTVEQVIHQHERVLEGYLGTEIPLTAGKILQISGETQKMAAISGELSSLVGRFTFPLTPAAYIALKERVAKIKKEIGGVTNEYKLKAYSELEKVALSEDERRSTEAVLNANLAILERAKECLGIVEGTNIRLRIITKKRNEWEETIKTAFLEMAQILQDLENGVYEGHPRKREQIARHISGESEFSLIGKLNKISGPEYWQRIQSRQVQGLGRVGDLLRGNQDKQAKKILAEAILKLERVVREKEERGAKDERRK